MKILRILAILALLSGSAFADGTKLYTASGTVTNTGIRLVGSGIVYHKLTWYKTGTVSTCTVFVDSSADGSSWSAGGVFGSQDCSSNGVTVITAATVNYVRVRVASWTGTGSVLLRWSGYNNRPGGLPNPGADGACVVSSTGDWVRGACAGGTAELNSILNPTDSKAFTMGAYTANFNFTGNYGTNWAYSISSSAGSAGATGYLFEVSAGHADNKVASFTNSAGKGLTIGADGIVRFTTQETLGPAVSTLDSDFQGWIYDDSFTAIGVNARSTTNDNPAIVGAGQDTAAFWGLTLATADITSPAAFPTVGADFGVLAKPGPGITIAHITGVHAYNDLLTTTGTVTDADAVWINAAESSGTTVTNNHGVHIDNLSGVGTTTAGVYVADQGTNDAHYSIYSAGGRNYLAGPLDMPETAAANPPSGSCRQYVDSTTHRVTWITSTGATCLSASNIPATPLPTPGTSLTMAGPRGYGFCSGGACAVTLPTPVAGYEFCIRNANNQTNVITLLNIASVQYEAPARTSYYAANRKLVSGGAVTDQICVLGYDATHYAVMSSVGTWTDTAP